jgi:hypothetical protein
MIEKPLGFLEIRAAVNCFMSIYISSIYIYILAAAVSANTYVYILILFPPAYSYCRSTYIYVILNGVTSTMYIRTCTGTVDTVYVWRESCGMFKVIRADETIFW